MIFYYETQHRVRRSTIECFQGGKQGKYRKIILYFTIISSKFGCMPGSLTYSTTEKDSDS